MTTTQDRIRIAASKLLTPDLNLLVARNDKGKDLGVVDIYFRDKTYSCSIDLMEAIIAESNSNENFKLLIEQRCDLLPKTQ